MNALQRCLIVTWLLTGLAVPAHAQWVVTDPGNLVQNVLTAARSLLQVKNQVEQLKHEAQSLQNEARNLRALDYNSLGDLRRALEATDSKKCSMRLPSSTPKRSKTTSKPSQA